LRAWWEEDRTMTQRFFNEMMHGSGGAPYFCEPWVAEVIVREHLYSPAMLAILPLQDYLAVDGAVRYPGDPADERINIPANPRHYWRWRMHLSVEDLIANKGLCEHIRSMIIDAARGI
jgi:4-alpha-glucanotransferase